MGGFGSGGGRGAAREGRFLKLDAARLKQFGYLGAKPVQGVMIWTQGAQEVARMNAYGAADRFLLSYDIQKQGEAARRRFERIDYAFTEPHFGGRRVWLICPRCKGRKRTLWGPDPFLCGACQGLVYDSQSYSALDRVHERMRTRRKKLAPNGRWSADECLPFKPKRMRAATYAKIWAEEERDRVIFDAEQIRRFGQILV